MTGVVTNPDKPFGRRKQFKAPPVKIAAQEHGIEVLQPSKVRDPSFLAQLRSFEPDAGVVVAYGKILPAELLAVPRLGFVNVHFSLLPAYRGAAPVQRALLAGDEVTGVSIMVLSEGMDEGPVLTRLEVAIDADETAGELGSRLASDGARVLIDSLRAYARGLVEPEPQNDSRATYAPKVTMEEARVDWRKPAEQVHNLVRASNPEPGAWTELRGERIKILRTALTARDDLAPGRLEVAARTLSCGTRTTAVEIRQAQRAGGKPVPGADLARGLRLTEGERFSS